MEGRLTCGYRGQPSLPISPVMASPISSLGAYEGPNGIVALLPSTNDMPFVKPDIFEVYFSDLKSVRIVKEEHFCDADGEPLVGCKPARGCWDFRVERDSIDSLHCYWDQRHRRSACWTR